MLTAIFMVAFFFFFVCKAGYTKYELETEKKNFQNVLFNAR